MNAEDSLRTGDLQGALDALQAQVRTDPSNADLRVFLFQLLCVRGEWDRALTQLDVAGGMDAKTLAMVHTYRDLLQCEALRSRVFAGGTTPLVFGEPADWVARVLEALRLDSQGRHDDAQTMRLAAYDDVPVVAGQINDEPFEWVADADSRIGPFLEAVVSGRYYWIPFYRIREVRMETPEDLRDLVWTPAEFLWQNGGEAVGFIPTRYPGTETGGDDSLKLSRQTAWQQMAEGVYQGLGQRMVATNATEIPLLDIRSISFSECPPDA